MQGRQGQAPAPRPDQHALLSSPLHPPLSLSLLLIHPLLRSVSALSAKSRFFSNEEVSSSLLSPHPPGSVTSASPAPSGKYCVQQVLHIKNSEGGFCLPALVPQNTCWWLPPWPALFLCCAHSQHWKWEEEEGLLNAGISGSRWAVSWANEGNFLRVVRR